MIKKRYFAGPAVTLLLAALDFYFFYNTKEFSFFLVVSLLIGAVPFLVAFIIERNLQKEYEARFLEFSRDLVENVKSGTPISKSILNLRTRNYGALSFYVQKLANQISIGIPLTGALNTFAKDTGSQTISRAVVLISEAERAGGQIETILESVSNSINQIEELKKQRKSAVYNLMVQGYIIFFIFILIMLILQYQIVPRIPASGEPIGGLSVQIKPLDAGSFATPLLILLIVQSVFSGLVIGKISEGSISDGIKHSFILLAITLLVKTGATAFFG
jgi:flagellar protein FlaJ